MSSTSRISFPLRVSRVHEVCGPSAVSFSTISAAHARAVMWIRERWHPDVINPVGLAHFFDPSKLLVAQVKDQNQGLAVMEETLRDGVVPVVVIELSQPLSLIAGRRLQLAAKAGNATGLCIIPEGMGSNAAETRWHCAPVFEAGDSTLQNWKLIKNKSGTLGAWDVRWDSTTRRLGVVSPSGERAGVANAAH